MPRKLKHCRLRWKDWASLHQFNEHHPELKGFSEFYDQQVRPYLLGQEEARKMALKKAIAFGSLIAVIGLIIAIALVIKSGTGKLFFFIAFVTIVAVVSLYQYMFRDVSALTKQKIVGSICQFAGWTFDAKPSVGPELNIWTALRLIPAGYGTGSATKNFSNGKKTKYEDHIFGRAHDTDFESFEVKLTRKVDDKTVTEFHGQLMAITFPRKFLGRTIVLRDKGWLQGKKKGEMKRVGLVDPVFEKIFEAYGTDQVEARYLLTPTFMQKLVDLEHSIDGKNIRFGFDSSKLFIAVETGNQFESGSMLEPLMTPARTQKILDEIGAIYDVIDGVMTR